MFKGGVWGEGTSNLKVLCFWLPEDWDQLFSFLNDFGQVDTTETRRMCYLFWAASKFVHCILYCLCSFREVIEMYVHLC